MARFWRAAYRAQYRMLAWLDPLIRAVWRRFGIGNVVDFSVPRRRGGGERSRLIGLLQVAGRTYVGHPNGDVGWTRDLEASGRGSVTYPNGASWQFRATRLASGTEREAVIRSTNQHPFPGDLMYRLGRGHIRAVGVFFRLEDE